MSDKVTDWLRQIVPTLWAALIAFLVAKGAPAWLADFLGGMTHEVIVPAVLAGTYAILVKVEPYLPAFLRAILMGSSKLPTYGKHAK